MRLVDNAQERILKRVEDQKMLDTTPNADVNTTWNQIVRKKQKALEVGPAFRYSHRSTIERLEDKAMRDPVSSELVQIDHTSPHKSVIGGSSTMSNGRSSYLRGSGMHTGVRFAGKDKSPERG